MSPMTGCSLLHRPFSHGMGAACKACRQHGLLGGVLRAGLLVGCDVVVKRDTATEPASHMTAASQSTNISAWGTGQGTLAGKQALRALPRCCAASCITCSGCQAGRHGPSGLQQHQ